MATGSIKLGDLNSQISGGLWSSGESILNWATQRQEYKDTLMEEANNARINEMQGESDSLLEQSINSTDPKTINMTSSACTLNDLAIAIDKWIFKTKGRHVDTVKYPTANSIVDQWRTDFPIDGKYIDACLQGRTDLPTTLQMMGIALPEESENKQLPSKGTTNNRKLEFNSNVGIRQNLTPETNERNDNLIQYIPTHSLNDESNNGRVLDFADNVVASVANMYLGLVDMVLNPIDTTSNAFKAVVGTINNISGLDDKIENGEFENEMLGKLYKDSNDIADGLWEVLLDRYWGKDENGNINDPLGGLVNLAGTFYEDPAGLISDTAGIVKGGAGLTKRGINLTKNLTKDPSTLKNIDKAANVAEDVRKYADALDPMTMAMHPFETANKIKSGGGRARGAVKNSNIGQNVAKVTNKVNEALGVSNKFKRLGMLADTWVGKMLFPEAKDIYKKLAPMGTQDIGKFEKDFGIKYGDHLNKYGITGKTPQEIVEQLQSVNDDLYKQVTDAAKAIEKPIELAGEEQQAMRGMALYNIQHARNTQPWNGELLRKLVDDYDKINTGSIDTSDFLFEKRYFERKSKFTYGKQSSNNPAMYELATNIDSMAREILLSHTDKNGFENLREINDEIRKNRAIIDGMGRDVVKDAYLEGVGLSDLIRAAAAYDSKTLSKHAIRYGLDWIKNSPTILNLRLKLGNKLRGKSSSKFQNVDMDEIYNKNAANRIENEYNFAMGDGTPRLGEITEGGVAATDNMGWAKKNADEALNEALKFIETYAEGQPKLPIDSSKVEIIDNIKDTTNTKKDESFFANVNRGKKKTKTVKVGDKTWTETPFFDSILN